MRRMPMGKFEKQFISHFLFSFDFDLKFMGTYEPDKTGFL